jgi:hypothetical protein
VTTSRAQPTPAPSSPDVGNRAAQVAPSTHPALGAANVASSHSRGGGADRITRSHTVQRAHSVAGSSSDDVSGTGAAPVNPCTLVSLPEAQSITGSAIVGRIEAPLGPTCIYRSSSSKADVTLTIEYESFSQVTRHMAARKAMAISGHRSYCGRLGATMLFVPLADGHVLNVTAPCDVAERFATLAVGRLA